MASFCGLEWSMEPACCLYPYNRKSAKVLANSYFFTYNHPCNCVAFMFHSPKPLPPPRRKLRIYLGGKKNLWRFRTLQQNNLFLPLSIKLHHVHLHPSPACVTGSCLKIPCDWKHFHLIFGCCHSEVVLLLVGCEIFAGTDVAYEIPLLIAFLHCSVPKFPFPTLFFCFVFVDVPISHLCLICLYLHTCIFGPWIVLTGCVVLLKHLQTGRVKGSCILVLVVRFRTYDVKRVQKACVFCSQPNRDASTPFLPLNQATVPVLYVL